MRSELKRLFMGFIYSLMTFSFIMAPIPSISISYAQEADYGDNTKERKKIYKKGEDFDEIREKTTLKKYSEEHQGLASILQQYTVSMMGITLLNALKFKYTHDDNPLLYGNDCGSNNAAKVTVRVAQLGALLFLLGDITANFKYSKSARIAAEEFEKSNWDPKEKQNFDDMTDEQKEVLAENDQATSSLTEQNTTLRGFQTLENLLIDKEKAIKTKKAFVAAATLANGVSFGYELTNLIKCKIKCGKDIASNKTALAKYAGYMGTATGVVSGLISSYTAASAVCPGCCGCMAAQVAACTSLQGQLQAFNTSVGVKIGKNEAKGVKTEAQRIAEDEVARAKNLVIMKTKILEIAKAGSKELVGDISKIMKDVEKAKKALEQAQEVLNQVSAVAVNADLKQSIAQSGPMVGTANICSGSSIAVGKALQAYYEYAFLKIQCCGGDGTNSVLAKQAYIDKQLLKANIDTLAAGGATIKESAKKIADEAFKQSREKIAKLAKKKVTDQLIKSMGSKLTGDWSSKLSQLSSSMEGKTDFGDTPGTYVVQGVPTTGVFGRKQDIVLKPLFGGNKSSFFKTKSKEEEELEQATKYYIQQSFEASLRRIAEKNYINKKYISPKDDLKFLLDQEQKINNILFFYDQMVHELSAEQLAHYEFMNHRYWKTIQHMVSNLVMPKAHAIMGGMLGGGSAVGLGLKVVASMLDLPEEWGAILNIGGNLMMLQGLTKAYAEAWGLIKPVGRTATWGILTAVLAFVYKFDSDALKEIEKRRKGVIEERNKWLKSNARSNAVAWDRDSTTYTGTDSSSRSRSSSQGFIQQCAVPSGNGFKPASCPQSTTSSAFNLGKPDPAASKLLSPSHLKGMSTISKLSSQTANGNLKEDALSGSNLAEIERMNNAIAERNGELLDIYDKMEAEANKKRKKKTLPLSKTLAALRNAFSGGQPSAIEGSADSFSASAPALGSFSRDNKEEGSGKVEASNGSAGASSAGAPAAAPSFDLDLLGDDGGIEDTDTASDAVADGESERKEENLDDFELNHDDINKKKEVSIFKILSNRYILSYPKVLEEEVGGESASSETEVKKE
jgi:hypothetical protein